MYETVWTDVDGDELGLTVSDSNVYFRVQDDNEVRVPKEGLAALLRRIAEHAGIDVLILEMPASRLSTRKLIVSSNPAVTDKVSLDAGFNYAERIPIPEVARLIWDLAEATAKISEYVDDTIVRKFAADMHTSGMVIVNAMETAKHMIRLGYQKQELPKRKEGIHIFNNLSEITTA